MFNQNKVDQYIDFLTRDFLGNHWLPLEIQACGHEVCVVCRRKFFSGETVLFLGNSFAGACIHDTCPDDVN